MQQYSNQEIPDSYGKLIGEIASSSAELVRNELRLAKEEIKAAASLVGRHSLRAILGLVFLATSLPPFLAFLVIGLGELLGARYWLSAILVSLTLATTGALLTYFTLRRIGREDLKLFHTVQSLELEADVISDRIGKIRNAMKRRAV